MATLHNISINIADILVRLTSPLSAVELGIEEQLKPYFGLPKSPAAKVALSWEESNGVPTPRGEMIYTPGSVLKLYREDPDYYYAELTNDEYGTAQGPSVLRANPAWDDLTIFEQRTGSNWKSLIGTFAGELIIRTAIVYTGGLFFHSSCLEDKGRGIIFIGHSGVGKSTQLALWSQEPGVIAINDDRIAVRVVSGGPMCYGIPWSGSEGISCNHRTLLKAMIFLEQALHNHIELIPKASAAPLLAACAFLPFWDRTLMLRAMANLNTILEHVPIYKLRCRPEKEVIPLVRSVL